MEPMGTVILLQGTPFEGLGTLRLLGPQTKRTFWNPGSQLGGTGPCLGGSLDP